MKKISCFTLIVLMLFSLVSCTTSIPNSAEAKEKMEALGYDVELSVQYGKAVTGVGVQQITFLFCDKGEDFLQAYFFTNEEDTKKFYKDNCLSLESDVEVIKKNRYSIYRGTKVAAEDFLS